MGWRSPYSIRPGSMPTASVQRPPDTRFYGTRQGPRRAAEKYIRGVVETAAALGSPVVCGPLFKAVGDMDQSVPLRRQRLETVKVMRPLMGYAEEAGVTLAFEPLNRFETNFVNTVGQGIEFCRQLRSTSAGLLLDTFHMHIEEKDTAAAIRAAAKAGVLSHFHASENDRGVAGTGQVRWPEVAKALRGVRYKGWIVTESFSQKVEAIKTAVSCWRPFYESEEVFMREGLRFLRRVVSR
jgi:D-psicose/D-tagatose/L-ribulose 3-epimerase